MPKQYSYQNLPVFYRVIILDQDVSSDVVEIPSIDQSVDYPQLNSYRIAEANITLKRGVNDPYNPNKSSNFFTENGGNASGYKSLVKIEAGFILSNGTEEKQTLLQGIIINTNVDARTGNVSIVVSDNSQDMRTKPLQDFGLEKTIRLQRGQSLGSTGVYPLPNAVVPPSEESFSAITTTGTTMTIKENLDTEGVLDETNYDLEEGELRTEGGPLLNMPGNADHQGEPVLTFKAPYRNKSIKFLVEKILANYDITIDQAQRNLIELPKVIRPTDSFSTSGRPGYDIENSTGSNYWFWEGFVTDFIGNNNEIHFLYSGGRGTSSTSHIIRYNIDTQENEIIYTSTTYQEWWRFIGVDSNTDGSYDTFYVLGTQPPTTRDNRIDYTGTTTRGFYNSSVPSASAQVYPRIWRIITGTSPTQVIWVPSSSSFRPQLAYHYTIGDLYKDHNSCDVPESRVGFKNHSNNLYYRFANQSTFGVARVAMSNSSSTPSTPTSMLSVARDQDGFNSCNHDFTIDEDNNTLYGAFTWVNNSSSQMKIVSRSLS